MNNIVNTISVSSGKMVQKKKTNETIGTELRDYSNDKCKKTKQKKPCPSFFFSLSFFF